jgi:hypothetical protein
MAYIPMEEVTMLSGLFQVKNWELYETTNFYLVKPEYVLPLMQN